MWYQAAIHLEPGCSNRRTHPCPRERVECRLPEAAATTAVLSSQGGQTHDVAVATLQCGKLSASMNAWNEISPQGQTQAEGAADGCSNLCKIQI